MPGTLAAGVEHLDEAGCERVTYGSHWSLAKGLKHVAKNPSSLGSNNLPQLLERAKETGDLTALDQFVQKTSDSFMTDTTDPF